MSRRKAHTGVYRGKVLATHVTEALWQTTCYQALKDDVTVSDLVAEAVQAYLRNRGVVVATYTQLVGQAEAQFNA